MNNKQFNEWIIASIKMSLVLYFLINCKFGVNNKQLAIHRIDSFFNKNGIYSIFF